MDIENSFQGAADSFFGFLPNLLGSLLLLLIGYVVAKMVAALVRKLSEKAALDRHLAETDSGRFVENMMPGASVSRTIGLVVFWLVFGFFLVAAAGALQIPVVTAFMTQVLAYLPNIVVALLIFVVAALLAGAVSKGTARMLQDSAMGRIVSTVAPALIMVIAMFMILEQLNIAEQIVEIAFAATMFALALGLALAFGLGGRPVAQRLLEEGYAKSRSTTGAAPRDSDPSAAERDPGGGAYGSTATGANPQNTYHESTGRNLGS